MAKLLLRVSSNIGKLESSLTNVNRNLHTISPLTRLTSLKTDNKLQTLIHSVELVSQKPRISLTQNRFQHSGRFENYENEYELSNRYHNSSNRNNRFHQEEERSYRSRNKSFRDNDRYEERNFRTRDWDFGEDIEERNWENVKLVKLQKNVYNPLDKVNQRSHEEIVAFRKENQITIVNDKKENSIPNPIFEFEEGGFSEEILDKLKTLGFNRPMPIQAQAWPIVMSGRDLIGIGETGSGKTLGFLLPALLHIVNHPERNTRNRHSNGPIALVMAPTRELAQQIHSVAIQFGKGSQRIRSTCLFGGSSKGNQIRDLQGGVDLVIATPGRLIDLIASNCTSLERCSYIVLDEADRMLDMGFEPQIRKILRQIRPDRQMLLWSATWPDDVKDLADDFLVPAHSGNAEPYVQLNIGSIDLQAAQTIKQNIEIFSGMNEGNRTNRLLELLNEINGHSNSEMEKTLIFAETKRDVDFLERILRRDGHNASSIHGGKTQMQRDSVLSRFRSGFTPILIATDVAARGIDVSDIKYVINYEFPRNVEDYVHRIGRTGRAGKTGTSYAFFSESNYKLAKPLIKILKEAQQEIPDELMEMANPLSKGKQQNNRSSYGRRSIEYDRDEQRYKRDFLPHNRRKKFNLLYEE